MGQGEEAQSAGVQMMNESTNPGEVILVVDAPVTVADTDPALVHETGEEIVVGQDLETEGGPENGQETDP